MCVQFLSNISSYCCFREWDSMFSSIWGKDVYVYSNIWACGFYSWLRVLTCDYPQMFQQRMLELGIHLLDDSEYSEEDQEPGNNKDSWMTETDVNCVCYGLWTQLKNQASKVIIANPIVWVSERLTIRGSKLQDSARVLKDRHLRKANVIAHILKPREGREN